jgi:hypothetical protein
MRSSRVEQYNNGMLQQVERTSKNFLTVRNLLDRSEVGTTNPQRRCRDHRLLMTARRGHGSRIVALLRLGALSGEVLSSPVVKARVACLSRMQSSRWSSLLWID